MPTVLGTITALTVLAIFVPLTGRMGVDVPVELIIANLTAILVVLFVPTAVPLFHRFDRAVQIRVLLVLTAVTALSIVLFAGKDAFSATAPRRMFFMHEFNVPPLRSPVVCPLLPLTHDCRFLLLLCCTGHLRLLLGPPRFVSTRADLICPSRSSCRRH
jgi:hypothetical protein